MNGFIKEEHDSDVEVLDADVLKKNWLQNQVCLANQLMACGKHIPMKWIEFETFVKDNIDWQPSFGLIHAIWTKLCKIEQNVGLNTQEHQQARITQEKGQNVSEENTNFLKIDHPEESGAITEKLKLADKQSDIVSDAQNNILRSTDSSFSSLSSSHKRKKKKKHKSDRPSHENLDCNSGELSCNDVCSTELLKNDKTGYVSELKSISDETSSPPQNINNRKQKNKKSLEQNEQCWVTQNIKQESYDDEISAVDKEFSYKTSELPYPSCKKQKKKKKDSNKSLGASSSNEIENNFINGSMAASTDDEYISTSNSSSQKSRKRKSVNGIDENSSTLNKKKKKKSDAMSEEEAEALREELLADRIIELELPKVIKEMKGAITKIDKCISNLEIKGQLSKLDKHLNKLGNKSLIKKLENRQKST